MALTNAYIASFIMLELYSKEDFKKSDDLSITYLFQHQFKDCLKSFCLNAKTYVVIYWCVHVLPSDVHILQTLERRAHLSAQTLDAHTYAAIYLRNTPDNN